MENLSQLISRRLKELRLSKSDLATLIGKSRAYVGDLANGTAGTQSGQYRPSPAVITSLATHLKVTEAEILNAIGYNAGKPEARKPQNLPEGADPANIPAIYGNRSGWDYVADKQGDQREQISGTPRNKQGS